VAGKIIADTIEASGSQISLNVGNVTILTASSTGLTLTPTSNVNINVTNSTLAFGAGNVSFPSITASGDTNTGLYFPTADTIGFVEGGVESMRIDSSGNMGIGTSSPLNKLHISGATNGASGISIQSTGASGRRFTMYSDSAGGLVWYDDSGSAERMRIDSSGNVGIGTASPVSQLHLAKTSDLVFTQSGYGISWGGADNGSPRIYGSSAGSGGVSGYLAFKASTGSEAMRIDASGNLLVGTTAQLTNEKFGIDLSGSGRFAHWRSQNTSGNPTVFRISTGQFSGGISTGNFIYCDDGGSIKFFVAGSGVVNSTSTSITAISDNRLKENVRDLETGLDSILSLKPRRFDWKENQGTNKKNVAGFIAQEVELVLPELVGEWKNDPDDEIVYKSLAMGDIIPTLVKAIQELKAIVDAQAVEIAALKAK
jgi:hypothetical protein